MPDTPVYFLSVKPSISRWGMWPSMKRANALIERYTIEQPNLAYIDVSTPMLESAGSVRNDLFLDDGLHMNGEGYALWTAIVRPRLEAFMEAR
jgi:lysophospholipase L1-like esterase